ncbi:GNAT family N-acetyltransferase [Uliginosibacterium sp. TH139]|uniref:GNAT family N-acetyltransferase n=1 Tax=Uliginosibacterium sp. TH139 TaxID=2067453 RepID=UPI000C796E2D|nr:GNAT family N-acetyltransferase [Uliginosibacterium sp. TH139]PLK50718.1 hypothetical protein C0V76_02590 [Uliginosibacterium sp. TH139]
MLDGKLLFQAAGEVDLPVFAGLAKAGMAAYFTVHHMEWKPELFVEGFRTTENYKILLKENTVGVLRIAQEEDHIFVFDLHVEPGFRNRGVGSAALAFIREIAEQRKKASIRMCAFRTNPAIDLYLRSGFKIVTQDECLVKLRHEVSDAS